MMIPVMYRDSRIRFADQYDLDKLINTGQIVKFRRGDTWVVIGFDAVRRVNDGGYKGAERRKTHSSGM